MDLRGGLSVIRRAFASNASVASSDGTIELKSEFAVHECDSDQCAVCLEKECNTMLLPCTHQFHDECIIRWTEHQFTCPLCRTEISHFLPIRNVRAKAKADFVNVWEKHYLTQKAAEPEVLKPKTFSSIPRTVSLQQLAVVEPEPEKKCECCNGGLRDSQFIYFAFDRAFCSTPCRLKFARGSKNANTPRDDGCSSYYVDHSQVSRYLKASTKLGRPVAVKKRV